MAGKQRVFVEKTRLEEMLGDGLTNRQIAKELGCHHNTVRTLLRQHGLEPARLRGLPPEPVDELHSRCSKCSEVVLNTDFPYVMNKSDGRRLSYCRKCRWKQYRDNVSSSPEKFWKERTGRIRKRAEEEGIPFGLSDGHLLEVWNRQGGLCFYTDVELVSSFNEGLQPHSASVDKVVPSYGYVDGNVVICSARANSIKYDQTLEELENWMPSWYARLEPLLT